VPERKQLRRERLAQLKGLMTKNVTVSKGAAKFVRRTLWVLFIAFLVMLLLPILVGGSISTQSSW
jgi:preprotein translocase subunit SecG